MVEGCPRELRGARRIAVRGVGGMWLFRECYSPWSNNTKGWTEVRTSQKHFHRGKGLSSRIALLGKSKLPNLPTKKRK